MLDFLGQRQRVKGHIIGAGDGTRQRRLEGGFKASSIEQPLLPGSYIVPSRNIQYWLMA